MEIDGQLNIWDVMQQDAPEEAIKVVGAIDVHSMPISEFEVLLTYGDLTLIVAMIEDYVRGLDQIKAGDLNWEVYYRTKYKEMSKRIQEQIKYDYEKQLAKCMKSQKQDDIGEDALVLALKRG